MNSLPVKNQIGNDIWEKYRETKSLAIRNKILTAYLYVVTINAKRMSAVYKNKAELEDIVNQGVLALIDCVDRFDYHRGVQFDTYASIRVRGAIIDYLRQQDWVPRDIRKMSLQIENTYNELQAQLNRPPSDKEVAESAGMEIGDYQKLLSQVGSFFMLSYEELMTDSFGFVEPESSIKMPEQKIQEDELVDMIATSIDELNEKERLIISLYYYEELKLKEIAVILGLTPSRVSQIHAKALIKMKRSLTNYMNE